MPKKYYRELLSQIFIIILILIPTIYIKLTKEPLWRSGFSHFICNEKECTVKIYNKYSKLIKTKDVDITEIVDFDYIVDSSRAKDSYAAYVLLAIKDNGETFDLFEIDTYYDNIAASTMRTLRAEIKKDVININIKYPHKNFKAH